MKQWGTVILLICGLVLVTCSDDPEHKQINGWVTMGDPIENATISVYKTDGVQILASNDEVDRTGEHGTFIFSVQGPPQDFRVVTSGGKYAGQRFNVELMADVRSFDPDFDVVYINAVTTMVSAYLDQFPGIPFDEAVMNIQDFLKIPHNINIEEGLFVSEEYFSHAKFLSEANENDGFERFIQILLEELKHGKTHPFHSDEITGSAGSSELITYGPIMDKFLSGVLSGLTVGGVEWGLSRLLDQTGIDFLKSDSQRLKEMQKKLDEIFKTLVEIKMEIVELGNKIKEVKIEVRRADFNNRFSDVQKQFNNIYSINEQLNLFASHLSAGQDLTPEQEKLRDNLFNQISQLIYNQRDFIHQQLVGEGYLAGSGLLQIWGEIETSRGAFIHRDYSKSLYGFLDYFYAAQSMQTYLLIQYYTRNKWDDDIKTQLVEPYEKHIELQKEILPTPIPEKVMIHCDTGIMISPELAKYAYVKFTRRNFILNTYDQDDWYRNGYNYQYFINFGYAYYCQFWGANMWAYAKWLWYINNQQGDGEDRGNADFKKHSLGFYNWRTPNTNEIDAFFKRTPKSGTWAIKNGYLKEYINDNMNFMFINCTDISRWEDSDNYVWGIGTFYYSTSAGKTSPFNVAHYQFNKNQCYQQYNQYILRNVEKERDFRSACNYGGNKQYNGVCPYQNLCCCCCNYLFGNQMKYEGGWGGSINLNNGSNCLLVVRTPSEDEFYYYRLE